MFLTFSSYRNTSAKPVQVVQLLILLYFINHAENDPMQSNCKENSIGIHNTRQRSCFIFLARDSMLSALYAIAGPSVRPSVRPSVTRVDQSKTVERIIEILSPSDRPNILVFRHQRSLRKSDGFTPNGCAKYRVGQKTGPFLRVINFATVGARNARDMSKFSKFYLEKNKKLACQCL